MNKIAFWDFSGVLYAISHLNSEYDDFTYYTQTINEWIKGTLQEVNTQEFILFLDEGKTFRHKKYPDYKANRKPMYLKFLNDLKHYVKEKYKAVVVEGLEADDLVLYANNVFPDYEYVVIGTDKDLLQKEGIFFNPKTKHLEYLTKEEAALNLFTQVLTGDSVDNIQGLPQCGEKTALKYLSDNPNKSLLDLTIQAFIYGLPDYRKTIKGFSLSEALEKWQKTYNLVKLLSTPEELTNWGFDINNINKKIMNGKNNR